MEFMRVSELPAESLLVLKIGEKRLGGIVQANFTVFKTEQNSSIEILGDLKQHNSFFRV